MEMRSGDEKQRGQKQNACMLFRAHVSGGRFGNFVLLPPTNGNPPSRVERGPHEASPRPRLPTDTTTAAALTKYQMTQVQTGDILMAQLA